MFDILTHLKPKKNNSLPKSQHIEPHVEYHDVHTAQQSRFLFPLQVVFYVMLVINFCSLSFFFVSNDQYIVITILMWVSGVFCMLCLPIWFGFSRSLQHDKGTLLEVDNKYGLIKYTNPERNLNLLFHKSQVEKCEIRKSLISPFHVEYLILNLSGGIKLKISSLVINPKEMAREFTLPYTVSRGMFPLSTAA